MRRVSAIWESLYSRSLYTEAFSSWEGIGFRTIALLALIHTAVLSIGLQAELKRFMKEECPPVLQQVPTITFKDGKASTPEAKEYRIMSGKGDLLAIIDTRTPKSPADLAGASVFFAGEEMVVQNALGQRETQTFESFGESSLNQEEANKVLTAIRDTGWIFFTPMIFGLLLLWRMMELLLYSLVTIMVCSSKELKCSYAAKLRLTSLALAAWLTIRVVLSLVDVSFFNIFACFAGVMIVASYISFGVSAAKEQAEEAAQPPPLP